MLVERVQFKMLFQIWPNVDHCDRDYRTLWLGGWVVGRGHLLSCFIRAKVAHFSSQYLTSRLLVVKHGGRKDNSCTWLLLCRCLPVITSFVSFLSLPSSS